MNQRFNPPITIYRICYRDGKYFPVQAKLIGKNKGWWKVKCDDGKVVNLNGGRFKTDSYRDRSDRISGFGASWRYHETLFEAWRSGLHSLVRKVRIVPYDKQLQWEAELEHYFRCSTISLATWKVEA